MLYRPYTPEDFADLYAIEEVCFGPPQRFGRRTMRQLVASSNGATWIAEEKGRMAGFAIVEWRDDVHGISSYIATIELLPKFRGRGVGRELMRRLEASARAAGAASIWLHVDERNDLAVRLYEASGYLPAGREEHYYASNRAAVVYMKVLGA